MQTTSCTGTIIWIDRKCDLITEDVPCTFYEANLLCRLESGIYFVKHGENQEIRIGKFLFLAKEIEADTVHTVKSSDLDIPLCKLKPLTMVEMKNTGVVVVCSVEGDISKFVMILTDKRGNEAIEILEIEYSVSKLRVHLSANTTSEDIESQTTNIADSSLAENAQSTTSEEVEGQKENFIESTEQTSETALFGEAESQTSESTLRNIAEATVVDLEMDQDGNIMFLLESKDGKTYCVCTKYFLP